MQGVDPHVNHGWECCRGDRSQGDRYEVVLLQGAVAKEALAIWFARGADRGAAGGVERLL